MTVRIRKLTIDDQAALQAAGFVFTAEMLLVGADRNLTICLVLDDDGEIAGLAHASAVSTAEGSDPTTAILDQLMIKPSHIDFGPKLTGRLAASAHTRGFSQVFARIVPAAADGWQESGWQVSRPGFAFGWVEADLSTNLIRTLAADDVRDDGKILALRLSERTDLYTFAFENGHAASGTRSDRALRGFRELVDHPLSEVAGSINIGLYRVI
jgi:hypothetical protein